MHSWVPTKCSGIQILTIKLLLVISIVFVFFRTHCRTGLSYSITFSRHTTHLCWIICWRGIDHSQTLKNKSLSEKRHLVSSILKLWNKTRQRQGCGDILTLLKSHCQTKLVWQWLRNRVKMLPQLVSVMYCP